MATSLDPPAPYDLRLIPSLNLTHRHLKAIHDLFDTNYQQANHAYLDQSLKKLRFTALAFHQDLAVGFALGDAVRSPIPRLGQNHCVALAGICCVSPDHRRRGLFSRLEMESLRGSGELKADERALLCGRMAHPASFRTLRRLPSVVPKTGVPITAWQKEVGLRVADLYGVVLDPETFVVQGKGAPIGFPKIDMDVEAEEWLPFEKVNRQQGDSLLGISWVPDPPEGWFS